MIGIIAAMDVEMEALSALAKNKKEEKVSGLTFTRGKIGNKEVVFTVCGIGKVHAALCAEAMILRYAPEAIVNIGVAGTLTDQLSIGDVVVGSAAVCHDFDTTAFGDPPGLLPGFESVRIPLSAELNERFMKILAKEEIRSIPGVIASGDQFINDRASKDRIRETFGAVACEMEGAAIAQTAFINRVPCAILRSISDSANGSAGDYEKFKYLAAEHATRVISAFLSSF